MKTNRIRHTIIGLITISLGTVAPLARAQIRLSEGVMISESIAFKYRPSLTSEPGKVELLRVAVLKEFSSASNRYQRLSSEFAIQKGWLSDSGVSREKIELTSEPLNLDLYGSFSIYLKKLSYRECYSLINDSATISRFDDVWLNERPIFGVPQKAGNKSVCISEWPLQSGKNTLRYHAH
jgi:hypothetical protein